VSAPKVVVVDGNNVMGAAADGWWRDRPAAVRRLLGRLQCYRRAKGDELALVLVLDVPQPDLPEGDHDGVTVTYARRRGRDAADDRIRELLGELPGGIDAVVTSDRALADDVRKAGAEVIGAGGFLSRMGAAGC
jgi:predicted RNA-binding protein with PIN domain